MVCAVIAFNVLQAERDIYFSVVPTSMSLQSVLSPKAGEDTKTSFAHLESRKGPRKLDFSRLMVELFLTLKTACRIVVQYESISAFWPDYTNSLKLNFLRFCPANHFYRKVISLWRFLL